MQGHVAAGYPLWAMTTNHYIPLSKTKYSRAHVVVISCSRQRRIGCGSLYRRRRHAVTTPCCSRASTFLPLTTLNCRARNYVPVHVNRATSSCRWEPTTGFRGPLEQGLPPSCHEGAIEFSWSRPLAQHPAQAIRCLSRIRCPSWTSLGQPPPLAGADRLLAALV